MTEVSGGLRCLEVWKGRLSSFCLMEELNCSTGSSQKFLFHDTSDGFKCPPGLQAGQVTTSWTLKPPSHAVLQDEV